MLETQAFEIVDHCIGDGDGAFPDRPAVPILDARAAPAKTNLALRIAEFLLQVAPPDFAGVIERDDFIPTRLSVRSNSPHF